MKKIPSVPFFRNALVEIVAVDKVGAHSFDMKRPNVVKGAIDSGKIQKIQGKSKPSGLGNQMF